MDRRQFVTTGFAGGFAGLVALLFPALARAAEDAGADGPIVSKIMLEDDRLWIAASIAGGEPLLFVIDTGAGFAYMRPDLARKFKLQIAGNQVLGGLGKKQVLGTTYLAHDVVFGGHIREPVVAFAGYDFGRGLPADAAGLLAAGLFTTRDSEVDFEAGEWRLWPRGRPDRIGFEKLDSSIGGNGRADRYSDRMIVTAAIDGKSYRLMLDTGAPGGLLLLPDAARRSGLISDDTPFAPQPTSGFGGRAAKLSRRIRADTLQLGPLLVRKPLVTLMDPEQNSRIDHDGLIGLPYISLLTLSTDVRADRVWARRNGRPDPQEGYRMAGIWIEKAPSGAATVAMVGTGSPAAAAGVRAGDEIADPPTFAEALRRIGGGPGRAVSIGLRRDGQTLPVHYVLKDYL